MLLLWFIVVVGTAVATVELVLVARQRRLFMRDPQRRTFFVRYAQRQASRASGTAVPPSPAASAPAFPPAPVACARPVPPSSGAALTEALPRSASNMTAAVVYVDVDGRCTFANPAARQLLHWTTEQPALRDVLAGGREESDALLAVLARQGLIEQHPSMLAGPAPAPLEISAIALRDRDDNLWGAALFIRPAAGGAAVPPPPPRGPSRP